MRSRSLARPDGASGDVNGRCDLLLEYAMLTPRDPRMLTWTLSTASALG